MDTIFAMKFMLQRFKLEVSVPWLIQCNLFVLRGCIIIEREVITNKKRVIINLKKTVDFHTVQSILVAFHISTSHA
jgi:hypothetical protein